MSETKREVRIHINRDRYESPNPTTGAALYKLGKIGDHSELFKEVGGDHEDELIRNDDAKVDIKEDDHFYSEKDFIIIVNAQKKVATKRELTFAEVVALAFHPVPVGPSVMFTIVYRNGPHANPEGTLLEGNSLKIKNGMVFNVTRTDKS